jgi:uncharacterized membrane protein
VTTVIPMPAEVVMRTVLEMVQVRPAAMVWYAQRMNPATMVTPMLAALVTRIVPRLAQAPRVVMVRSAQN